MHENEYAYAVARIRANEVNLLTPAETEQLISAESYEAALRLLGDKGWHTDGVGHDYAPMLEEHVNAAWRLLKESYLKKLDMVGESGTCIVLLPLILLP